jgi:hypothetical protein
MFAISILVSASIFLSLATRLATNIPPSAKPGPMLTAVLVYSAASPLNERQEKVEPRHLYGEYYAGNGLDYNLNLSLDARGRFNCTWRGCLGVYGTATGEWTIDGSGIKTVTKNSTGMLKYHPLGRLVIVAFRGRYLLFQKDDQNLLQKWEAESTCLDEEAVALIEEAQKRCLKALLNYLQALGENLRLKTSAIGLLASPSGLGPLLATSALLPGKTMPMPSKVRPHGNRRNR